ncbi:MAG: LysR family transcriptional regulator [Phycisphaerae bacterium]|jgi:DNA-binding transcriptional LysR family regulator
MNLDVMKTFCDLVETGSFSKAAEANYISQSAVSQQLAKLEQELATQLISRGGGLVAPTEAGKTFYDGARTILRRYEQLVGEVKSAADAVRGVLRVGTIYSVGFYLLDPYVRKFLQAHPEVNLHVEYTKWNRIYAAVVSGEMDLGVVAYPEKHRSIEIIPLTQEDLVLVCSPRHRLAKAARVSPQDLEGEKFVAFEENIPTRRYIDRLLKTGGVEVSVVNEFDNIELLKRAVEINTGISILPRGNVEREAEHGDLVAIGFRDAQKWVRPLGILRRRGKAPSPAERMFLSILRAKG